MTNKDCENCKYYIGWIGEKIIRDFLRLRRRKYMQADLIYKCNGNWYLAEVKRQERYKPPPFEGHGLPKWQIERRLEFQKDTGIIAMLFIVEIPDNIIFVNQIDKLWAEEKYQTTGKSPRIIFPLKNYIKVH